jgi:hypothetical protein
MMAKSKKQIELEKEWGLGHNSPRFEDINIEGFYGECYGETLNSVLVLGREEMTKAEIKRHLTTARKIINDEEKTLEAFREIDLLVQAAWTHGYLSAREELGDELTELVQEWKDKQNKTRFYQDE